MIQITEKIIQKLWKQYKRTHKVNIEKIYTTT